MITNERIKESKNPDVKLMADNLDELSAISALADTEGGKLLVKTLMADVLSALDTLSVKYKELTVQEFIGLSASLKTNLDMIRVLKRAKKNTDELMGMLEEALKEE